MEVGALWLFGGRGWSQFMCRKSEFNWATSMADLSYKYKIVGVKLDKVLRGWIYGHMERALYQKARVQASYEKRCLYSSQGLHIYVGRMQ
jgi:hypothetical protein